jgi:hypothetical protein
MTAEPDLSKDIDAVRTTLSQAVSDAEASSDATQVVADDSINKVDNMGIEADSLVNKTTAYVASTTQGAAAVQAASNDALNTVNKLVASEKTQAEKERSEIERLTAKASDTNLRAVAEGQSALQGLANKYASLSMNTQQVFENYQYTMDQATEKLKTHAENSKAKSEQALEKAENKFASMLEDEKDFVGELGPDNKDFEKQMKEDSKEIISDNKDLRGDIKDIETNDKLMEYKKIEKGFQKTQKTITKGIEEVVEDAQDSLEDVLKDNEKHAKGFVKDGAKQLKSFVKMTEKATKDQASEIKSQEKDTAKLAKGLGKMEENLESMASKLSGDSGDFTTETSDVAHEIAEDTVSMNTDVNKAANKALDSAVTAANEMTSQISDANSKEITDLQNEQSAAVGKFQETIQGRVMDINKKVGGIAAAIQRAKTAADDVNTATSDTSAKIEVESLAAAKLAESAKKNAAASVYKIHQHVKAMADTDAMHLQDFGTDLDGVVSSMKTQLSSQGVALSGPTEQETQEVKRYLDSHFSSDSLKYEGKLSELFESYQAIANTMEGMGISPKGDVPEEHVSNQIKKWEESMEGLVKAQKDLQAQVTANKELAKKELAMKQNELEEAGREESEKIKNAKEKALRKTEQQAFERIGSMTRAITNEIARSQSLSAAAKQSDEYATSRLDKMSSDMTESEKIYAEMDTALRAKLSNCYALLAEHDSAMKAAGQSARETIKKALMDAEEKTKTFLAKFANDMLTRASDNQAAQLKAISDYEDKIINKFSASREVEKEEIGHLDNTAENLKFETENVTKTLEQAIAGTAEEAESEAQKAQLLAANTAAYKGTMQTDMANLANSVDDATDQAITAASTEEEAEIEAARNKLGARERQIAKSEAGVWQAATQKVDAVSGDIQTVQKLVSNIESGTNQKLEFIDKDLEDRVKQMGEHIEMDNEADEDGEAQFQSKLKQDDARSKSTDHRNTDLLGVMEKDVHALAHETEGKITGSMAKLDATSKAIAGDITTSIETAEITGRTAQQSLEESELDLERSRGDLRGQMKNVQHVLGAKLNETERATVTIAGLTKTERDMLEKNTAYLHQYDLLSQSQALGLIEGIASAIENGAKAVMSRYKEVQDHIDEVKNSVTGLKETDTFSTLGRIMSADTFVQHASVENQEVVNYMQEFQEDQDKFMTALVQSLEDVTYAMILHENEVAKEQEAMDADSAGMTTAVIGSISALINGNGDGDDANMLENMSGATLEMLLKKAMNGSDQDKAQVALFFKRIAAKGYDGIKHLKNAQAIMDVINSLAGGHGSYEMMKADLQKVVDFNQKLVDDERRRMEARGLKVADNLFFGNRGISAMRTPRDFEHLPKHVLDGYKYQAKIRVQDSYNREAFLERERAGLLKGSERARQALLQQEKRTNATDAEKKRMSHLRSLLETNAKLVHENYGLQNEHETISQSINATATKIRAMKGTKTAKVVDAKGQVAAAKTK